MLAHVDMDAFYASVEVLDNPALSGKPVIVGGTVRGVISACSYEARKKGLHSAMPIFQAKRLCPEGHYLPVRMARYQQVSREVMLVLESFSPVVEKVSVDEAYLDLAGSEKLWGPPREAGLAIKRAIREKTGLTCSVGIAPVRFLAKIASDRDKPDGLCLVDGLEEFLATVALKEVPGVGTKAQQKLSALGLSSLVELRALGEQRLERMFGLWGRRLWDLAHGRDETGLTPDREVKSVSAENTLAEDTADQEILASHLLTLCQKVCRRLRAKGLAGRGITLKLKTSDFRQITRSHAADQPVDRTELLYPEALKLLRANAKGQCFRLIGVGVDRLAGGQGGTELLFGKAERDKGRALAKAEDELFRRFGEKALVRAGSLAALDRKGDKGHNRD